jgi:hypothetical protein
VRMNLVEAQQERARAGVAAGAARRQAEAEVGRQNIRAIDSALASDIPEVRDLGRLASLPDEALDMVKRGELDPQAGAAIAATTPDPAEQAAMARIVADARPADVDEARAIIAERVAEKKAVTSAQTQMGAQEVDVAPVLQGEPRTFAADDMRNMVPVTRDNGNVEMVARETIGAVAERERKFAFIVETCIL